MSPASTVNMASSPPKPQITSGSAVAFEGLKPGCSTVLEAAPIGWQLFVLESGKSASIAFLLLLATDATRLLAQALRLLNNLTLTFRFTLIASHMGLTRSQTVNYSR